MAEKIITIGKTQERIVDTGPTMRRIDDAEFAAALGAEPCGARHAGALDLISLAELGNELIKRLRSTGGSPSSADATEKCKVHLSPADVASLEQITTGIEKRTGARPALGQVASVILRMHLESHKDAFAADASAEQPNGNVESQLPLGLIRDLIDQQIEPVRKQLNRLETEIRELTSAGR